MSSINSMIVHAAEEKRQVADIPASGIIFKDSINVEAFRDPKVEGVTIYISDFRRPLAERIAKDFFSDPSQASVACVRTGPVKMNKVRLESRGVCVCVCICCGLLIVFSALVFVFFSLPSIFPKLPLD